MEKPFIGAADRNKKYILEQLIELFSDCDSVLELGSGTGQHAVYFVDELRHLLWQPSDLSARLPGIAAWCGESPANNLLPPIELDIRDWPKLGQKYHAIFASNLVHYIEKRYLRVFFEESRKVLESGGILVLYGPFKQYNNYSSPADMQLDLMLRSENESFGIRTLEELVQVAGQQGMDLFKLISMPANNKLVCWKERSE